MRPQITWAQEQLNSAKACGAKAGKRKTSFAPAPQQVAALDYNRIALLIRRSLLNLIAGQIVTGRPVKPAPLL